MTRKLKIFAALALGAVLFSWVALVNGYPLLFEDTVGYLDGGMEFFRWRWPENDRPLPYSLFTWLLHREQSLWPVILVQGIILAHMIRLVLRVHGVTLNLPAMLGVYAFLATATPLSWYASQIMPDVFFGVLVLGMYLLGLCRGRIKPWETAYLFFLITASMCFHLSFLAVGCFLAAACILMRHIRPRMAPTPRPAMPVAALLLAFTVLLCFSWAGHKKISLTPNGPPFLLARMLADGPGKAYLRDACGRTAYALCPYLNQLPPTSSQFLWRFLPEISARDPAFKRAVLDEQVSIIINAARMFPGWTARNMARNTARQLMGFESTIHFYEGEKDSFVQKFPFAAPGFADSLQGRGFLNDGALRSMNLYHRAVVIISLILCTFFAFRCYRERQFYPITLMAWVALAFLANAFVAGALAGAFGRYEGRGVWLIPFCVILSASILRERPAASRRRNNETT